MGRPRISLAANLGVGDAIPDSRYLRGAWPEPEEQVLTSPPFICIEVLSKDDTLANMQERIDDYLKFGVPMLGDQSRQPARLDLRPRRQP